jgi:hypothetical protein
MNNSRHVILKRHTLAIAVAALVTVSALTACGGGGSSDSTNTSSASTSSSSAATTSAYTGTISGLGSVVVNGVRFGTTGAETADGDDPSHPYTKAFALGTTVTVKGAVDEASQTGTASSIEVHGGVRGQITAIGTNTFTVAGQTINVDSATVYDSASHATFNFASLTTSTCVEVFGVVDSTTGAILATRIEQLTALPTTFAVKGTASSVNTTAQTFSLTLRSGVTVTVDYSSATVLPSGASVADGVKVRILTATNPSSATTGSTLTATKLIVASDKQATGTIAKIQGAVKAISTDGKTWTIDDVTVDVSQSPTLSGFTSLSAVTTGTLVKVKGTFTAGVLVASAIESDAHERTATGGGTKLFGVVSASDSTASTFVVQGVTVTIDSSTQGTLPAVGTYVEVVARQVSGVLTATVIGTPSTTATARPFEVYGVAPCTAGISDLSGNFTLTLRHGTVAVDGSTATVTAGRQVSTDAATTALSCVVEVKGSMTTVGSVKTLKATAIEILKRAATVSLR